jgi:hypothetical protein
MNFLPSSYKKYLAAMVTVFAAIAIPAQATDCTTVCQQAASKAANDAVNQALPTVTAECARTSGYDMNGCVSPKLTAIGNATYQQVLAQCMGSCR